MTEARPLPDLTSPFPAVGRDGWMELVTKALKGGDFARRLQSRTADGIVIEPVYERRSDATVTARSAAVTPWGVVARLDHPVPASAAALALADLEGGATGLSLAFADSAAARGFGLAADSVAALDAALAGVMLDLITLRIEPGAAGRVNAALVAALVARRGHAPAAVKIDFGLDPIGVLASRGTFPAPWNEVARRLGEAVTALRGQGFTGPFVACDLRPYHEAGASEVQEIAGGLAAGIAYVRALRAAGLPLAAAFGALSWTVAVDADQLAGLAKLRALRRLWARVAAACGVAAAPMPIHAETAWRMMTARDPAVNMLRATTAVFAAGAGGADSIAVLPHTSACGLPDALGRRIARNTQLLLQEETNLWRVADPAAGAGSVEGLTDEFARAGWLAFQEIEAEGGLVESLVAGKVQTRIAAAAAARAKDIASRKAAITGTSEFPNLAETPAATLDVDRLVAAAAQPLRAGAALLGFDDLVAALAGGATRADVAQPPMTTVTAPALPSTRLAAPFEALRDAADRARAAGQAPQVFLANLGALTDYGARATWTTNLLSAGGIAVVGGDGFSASGEAGRAFAASGAGIACICGTDESYAEIGEATAQALKSAGATHVLLAGRPGEREAALRAAGVDQFLHAGQDVLAALQRLHAVLAGQTG